MTRYVARPLSGRNQTKRRAEFDEYDDWSAGDRIPVVEYDPSEPQFSGLYDANGAPLYKMPEKLGF